MTLKNAYLLIKVKRKRFFEFSNLQFKLLYFIEIAINKTPY